MRHDRSELVDYNQLSTQSFLAAVGPCSGERGTIRFNRTPIAQAVRGAATNAKGTQSDARNTDRGSRPLSSPFALATNPAIAAPQGKPRLLNRRGGDGSDIFLAALRAAHDALQNKRPRSADPNSDQNDWRDQGRDRSGRH